MEKTSIKLGTWVVIKDRNYNKSEIELFSVAKYNEKLKELHETTPLEVEVFKGKLPSFIIEDDTPTVETKENEV